MRHIIRSWKASNAITYRSSASAARKETKVTQVIPYAVGMSKTPVRILKRVILFPGTAVPARGPQARHHDTPRLCNGFQCLPCI